MLIEDILENREIKSSINIELEGVYLDGEKLSKNNPQNNYQNNFYQNNFYERVNSKLKS